MADSESPSPDAKDPAPVLPPVAKPLAPAPRVNPPNANAAKDAPPAGGPPGFSDFLEWMRSQTVGEGAQGASTQRGLIPKEKKKFQRRDAEAKSDKPADLPPTTDPPAKDAADSPTKDAAVPTAKSPPAYAPVDAPATVPPAKKESDSVPVAKSSATVSEPPPRVRRQQTPLKRNSWFGLAIQAGVLALLVGSFVLGRASVSKVVATAPSAAPAAPEVINSEGKATTKLLSSATAALIDQAMSAEQNSKFEEADEVFKRIKASGEQIRGLSFQIAQLALFQREYHRAIPLLNAAIADNENIADAYSLRATVSGVSGLIPNSAMNDYETASRVDPFDARNFFYWGEALRRLGKDQAAIVRLNQAIDRLREPELESSYRLKLRLAHLEAGQESEFADDLAKQLALPNPEMDWLITAAAVEIYHGRYAAAADFLDRAALRGDSEIFAVRLRDYYLYQFRDRKELARFYAKAPKVRPAAREEAPAPASPPGPDAPAPSIGLDVPVLPPPASPGATVPR